MLVLLMMVVFSVVAAKAQMVVAADYNYLYVGVPGATTAVPRSSVPYGNMLTKGDVLPLAVARYAREQAAYEFGRTGSIVHTAEAMTEPIMATMGLFSQISATVKATKAAKRARTTTRTTSTVQPVTTTATTTTPVKVNKNVTYSVSRQRFESANRQRCESAEDLISGF